MDPAFDRDELVALFDLRDRTYRLLRWIEEASDRGFLDLHRMEAVTTDAGAFRIWYQRHRESLPIDARPNEGEFDAFARFFLSYGQGTFVFRRTTGARLARNPRKRGVLTWEKAPHLQPRRAMQADRDGADRLEQDWLAQRALELEVDAPERAIARASAHALREARAMVAYAADLTRRRDGVGAGVPALVLWRRFAWKPEGSPKLRFTWTVDDVMRAADRLDDVLSREP